MSQDRPNILFIQADQLGAGFLPAYGNRVAKTPNLDRLAAGGVVFANAYCNFPLCAPSRFAMMSGRLASEIGAYDNGAEFPSSIPTIAHYLRLQGYRTAISGKMHFVGADLLHGLEERLTPEIYTAHFSWTANWAQLMYDFAPDARTMTETGIVKRSVQLDFDEEVGFRAKGKLYDLARDGGDQPFFLIASFTHPHDPYLCTQAHWDRIRHDDIDLPAVRGLSEHERDAHSKRVRTIYAVDQVELTDDLLRDVRHAYYANISYLDDKVGELLQTLEDCGFADNTVVVFTADHGDMMGEQDLFHKKVFFENAAHVPLMVHAPWLFEGGRSEDALVSLIDLFPSLLQLAQGGRVPELAEPVTGQSFYGLLTGEACERDNVVLSEILSESTTAPLLMIRRDHHKYVWSPIDPPLLFDLTADPAERRNLAGRPEVAAVETRLEAEVARRWDVARLTEDILVSQKRRLLIFEALAKGKQTSWDGALPPTGQRGYYRDQASYSDWVFSGSVT